MKKSKLLLTLFITFFKIGLFTFGGGYAMIALLEREFVENKKWISHEEFMDIIAIAESTPGPIAINSATYIGYKTAKVWGSFFSTVAVCIPSFVIIYTISLFFHAFLENQYVASAFKGIEACVAYLIISAGIKMSKKMKKTPANIIISILTIVVLSFTTLFSAKISSIYFIISGALIGLFIYLIKIAKKEVK